VVVFPMTVMPVVMVPLVIDMVDHRVGLRVLVTG
jgi:hypothetical protein